MPEVRRFLGLVMTMYSNDHAPPHVHVRYGGQKALMAIETLALLQGHLSPRVLGLVVEWRPSIGQSVLANWDFAVRQQPLKPIQPLE